MAAMFLQLILVSGLFMALYERKHTAAAQNYCSLPLQCGTEGRSNSLLVAIVGLKLVLQGQDLVIALVEARG